MFGFGLSSKDKEIIAVMEAMVAAWGLSEVASKDTVKKAFEATKREAKGRFGGNIYATDAGDAFIENEQYMGPRRAAGITEADVRRYWNRPALLVLLESRLLTMVAGTIVSNLSKNRQEGQTDLEVATEFRKIAPDYGDPATWDQKHPAHQGLTADDACLYLEFMPRIDAWCKRTNEIEQKNLLALYSTYNAMIRDLIRQGKM